MRTRTRLGLLLVTLVLAGACTPSVPVRTPAASAGSPSAAPGASSPSASPSQPTGTLRGALTAWYPDVSRSVRESAALQRIVDRISANNPELRLRVEYRPVGDIVTDFQSEAAAGRGPDLYLGPSDTLYDQARSGVLADLEGRLAGRLDDLREVAVEASRVDGRLYAVPESMRTVALYYDRTRLATPPATTAELLRAVKGGLKVGINVGVGSGAATYYLWGLYAAFGGRVLNDAGRCVADETGVADTLGYVAQLKEAGLLTFDDGARFQDAFRIGQLDAIVEGSWFIGDATTAKGADLGVAPLPAGPRGPSRPLVSVDAWYVNARSPDIDLAVDFALEFVKQENEQELVDAGGHLPADRTVRIPEPVTAAFAAAAEAGTPRPQGAQITAYWPNFATAWNNVLDLGGDPDQAVRDACAAVDKANGR